MASFRHTILNKVTMETRFLYEEKPTRAMDDVVNPTQEQIDDYPEDEMVILTEFGEPPVVGITEEPVQDVLD